MAKKTAKKTVKKTTTAATKKTTKKTKKAVETKKDNSGLRKPQVRILKALVKAKKPFTRAQIAEKAPVDAACCTEYLGSVDPEVRVANDKKHFTSLLSLKLVKAEQHDIDGKDIVVYGLTANGRKKAAAL